MLPQDSAADRIQINVSHVYPLQALNQRLNVLIANEPGVHTMKIQLILALSLSVLATNTFAADGYDKTGSASFSSEASASVERAHSDTYAADGFDKTGSAEAIG